MEGRRRVRGAELEVMEVVGVADIVGIVENEGLEGVVEEKYLVRVVDR